MNQRIFLSQAPPHGPLLLDTCPDGRTDRRTDGRNIRSKAIFPPPHYRIGGGDNRKKHTTKSIYISHLALNRNRVANVYIMTRITFRRKYFLTELLFKSNFYEKKVFFLQTHVDYYNNNVLNMCFDEQQLELLIYFRFHYTYTHARAKHVTLGFLVWFSSCHRTNLFHFILIYDYTYLLPDTVKLLHVGAKQLNTGDQFFVCFVNNKTGSLHVLNTMYGVLLASLLMAYI